jgi:hypothetical protein
MIAQRLLDACRAAGLSLQLEGQDVFVEAHRDPPPELLAELCQHKAELIEFLRAVPDGPDERAAIIAEGAGVPRSWAEGYAGLCVMPPPSGFSPERWQRIVDATGMFLDRWADTAIACAWTDLDVFGCNPVRPDARFDCMGLVLLLDHCEVVGVDEAGADLMNTGVRQRFYRRPLPPGTVSLWDLAR